MKVATWNVNSVGVRITHLEEFLRTTQPDILLLQEIKCINEKFPYDALDHLNYNVYVHGQKTYNGVAILSKYKADDIKINFPDNPIPQEARFIECSLNTSIGFCQVISVYVPNGGEVNSEKFHIKLRFFDELFRYLNSIKSFNANIIIGGDFNVAPFDIDVYSSSDLKDSTCFTLTEKQKMRSIINAGFYDLYRLASLDLQEFSWWDYRGGAFDKNLGMRIDMILGSSNIAQNISQVKMHYDMRAKDRPSDHIPVECTFLKK
ncbi:MAG: exodeoxyribonuclease III [Rickettsiaceae bacterium]